VAALVAGRDIHRLLPGNAILAATGKRLRTTPFRK
jgi:hypothetical protein